MRFAARRPAAPLDAWIEQLWMYEAAGGGAPAARWSERVLPTGALQLIVDLSPGGPCDSVPGGALVVGVHAGASIVEFESRMVLAGVQFRPGGAAPFFDLPLGELADTEAPLECLWGRLAHELRERLHEARRDDADSFAQIEQVLWCRLRRAARPREPQLHPAVQAALALWPEVDPSRLRRHDLVLPSVADVVEHGGLSARRFSELFAAQVGQSPKRYVRLRRFQLALRCLHAGVAFDGADLALACGYHDQSHFNHDFRAFSGLTPTQYRALRTEHANHVRVGG